MPAAGRLPKLISADATLASSECHHAMLRVAARPWRPPCRTTFCGRFASPAAGNDRGETTWPSTAPLSTTHRKGYVEQATALGFRLATLVHPTARVSSRATLAEGCFISALATIATRTTLGKSVFVNRSAAIGHHTTIGDYCTIQPRANIAGAITIGEQTYIGMGANIIDRLTIGKGCLIAAGATVVNNLPDRVLAMGVPAKVVKENIEPK